ncbi:MAG: DUF2341 domain-containing protein, partial [Bacteroidales bacterium]|nr:DUF2341 domain-containing protein [Bacteroidales bacterium]
MPEPVQKYIISALLLLFIPTVLWAQWLEGYSYRIQVTIPATQISGSSPHYNFPVLINTTIADLKTIVNGGYVEHSSGFDIAFTENHSITLDHQVENYSGNSGQLIAWVRIPVLNPASDYEFYIYFGNPDVSTDPSTSSTWSSAYVSVYHLYNSFLDGTNNVNHGTNHGSSSTTGKIGNGRSFNGTSDYIDLGNPSEFNFSTGNWTVSAWINTTDTWQNNVFSNGGDDNGGIRYVLASSETGGAGTAVLTTDDNSNKYQAISPAGITNNGQWHYIVGKREGTSIYIYHNSGGPEDITTITAGPGYNLSGTSQKNAYIGAGISQQYGTIIKYFDGFIDEVRVQNVARGTDWIQTEYNNQNSPGAFMSFGGREYYDDPCTGLLIPVTQCYTPVTYTNKWASSSGVSATSCDAISSYEDAWFKAVIPASGEVTVRTYTEQTSGWAYTIGIAAYTGTCTALSYLNSCDIDLINNPPDPAELVLNGLTPGDTLFIRMWEYQDDNKGKFRLSIFDDSTNPVISTCPADRDVNLDGDCGLTVPDLTGEVVASDNCTDPGDLVITQAPAAGTELSSAHGTTHNVTIYVYDEEGNQTSCIVTLTGNDNTDPEINCPVSGTQSLGTDDGACTYTHSGTGWNATGVDDNCTISSIEYTLTGDTNGSGTNLDGVVFNAGTTLVTWTATDDAGNTGECSFSVEVIDDETPTVTAASDIITTTSADGTGDCTVDVTVPDAVYDDNCESNLTWGMTGDVVDNGTGQVGTYNFPVGVTTITYTNTDGEGQQATDFMTVTVTDDEAPTVTSCPANISVSNDAGICGAVVTYSAPVFDDNCDGAGLSGTLTNGLASGSTFPVGITTVTYEYTDAASNGPAICTFTVEVTDDEDPLIVCPGQLSTQCDIADLLPYDNYAAFLASGGSASDNCGIDTDSFIHISDISDNNSCPETVTRAYQISDINGNTNTCEQIIIVNDITKPTFTQPVNITIYKDEDCNYDASVGVTGDVTDETDNCDTSLDATYVDNVVAGTCEGEEIINRLWSLTDDCGNTTTHMQVITAGDTISPTFTQPADITIYKDVICNYNATVGVTGDVTDEADNCDTSLDATYVVNIVAGSCEGEEIINRLWSLTDDCGNTTTHMQIITVTDTISPSFTKPPDIEIYRDADCNYDASISITGDVTDESDNCDTSLDATYVDNIVAGSCDGEEIISRLWSLTDDCGNTKTVTQTIYIYDNTAPTVTAPDDYTIEGCDVSYITDFAYNETETGITLAEYLALTGAAASDNCNIATV